MKIDLSDGWRELDREGRQARIRQELENRNWLDLVQVSLRSGGWPEQGSAVATIEDDPSQARIAATVEVDFREVLGGCPVGAYRRPGAGTISVWIDRGTGVGEASLEEAAIDAWGDDQYHGD